MYFYAESLQVAKHARKHRDPGWCRIAQLSGWVIGACPENFLTSEQAIELAANDVVAFTSALLQSFAIADGEMPAPVLD